MQKNKRNALEQVFEAVLWRSRLIILLAVIFSAIGSLALFFSGSFEIYHTVRHLFPEGSSEPDYSQLLIGIIGAVDLYLIGIVLLIFAFGIYELFISRIDIAREGDEGPHHNILEITSLDELKTKLIKVIVMVLIVSFFKSILSTSYQTPLEMLYFGLAILCVATCTFFLRKIGEE